MSAPDALSKPPHCSNCGHRISGTPWAFPLLDLRYEERLRFCDESCLDEYADETTHRVGTDREVEK